MLDFKDYKDATVALMTLGLAFTRSAIPMLDPESPIDSRTRMLLINAALLSFATKSNEISEAVARLHDREAVLNELKVLDAE